MQPVSLSNSALYLRWCMRLSCIKLIKGTLTSHLIIIIIIITLNSVLMFCVHFPLQPVGEDRAGDVERDGDFIRYLSHAADGAAAGLPVKDRADAQQTPRAVRFNLNLMGFFFSSGTA